ncbi:MAG: heptosyltransferase-3 [Gammaproteobacteria bacterium]|jgi:heptosyltransferase-3
MTVNKILFIGLSNVGDVIMTTPVLRSLHTNFPRAQFDIVADKRSMSLYGNYPFLNKLYLKDKNKLLRGVPALISELWKNSYDVIVDVRSDGLAYLLRGKKRYTKLKSKSYGPHAVEEIMGVVERLHGNERIPDTEIWLSKDNQSYAEEELSVFDSKDKLLALSVGDSRKPEKTLTTDKFIDMLNINEKYFSGVIFLGNDFETEVTDEVCKNISIPYIDTLGNSLLDAAALIENSCLYIGPDSGLGHIASAVKTPTISFFSMMSPERFLPWRGESICIQGNNNDARNISVDEISEAISGFY